MTETEEKESDKIAIGRKNRALSMLPTDGRSTGQQWQILMRKFSESGKEQCKSTSLEMPRLPRSAKQFPTGSEYEGQWNVLGMSGFGTYTFPYEGVMYVGQFEDGMFHGNGELRYECGAIIRGKWDKGQIVERKLIFADGLEYDEEDWKYCRMPDRRFTVEYEDQIQPGGNSYLTADQPTREIPPGYYDVGDGFYDPETKMVCKYDDPTGIVRSPGVEEYKWIMENCRKAPEEPVGPYKYLYEDWLDPALELDFPPPPAARMTLLDYFDDEEDMDGRFESSDTFFKNRQLFSYNPTVESRTSITKRQSITAGRKHSIHDKRQSAIGARASFKTDASSTLIFKPGSARHLSTTTGPKSATFRPSVSVAGSISSNLMEDKLHSTATMKSGYIGHPSNTQLVGEPLSLSHKSIVSAPLVPPPQGRPSTIAPGNQSRLSMLVSGNQSRPSTIGPDTGFQSRPSAMGIDISHPKANVSSVEPEKVSIMAFRPGKSQENALNPVSAKDILRPSNAKLHSDHVSSVGFVS